MFTGIIEQIGIVKNIKKEGGNLRMLVKCDFLNELQVDQSIAHNGVCLTIEKINVDAYEVVAVEETLKKTNIQGLMEGSKINLERCMKMNGRLDGHIVQGHVDETATVTSVDMVDGSWLFRFKLKKPTKLIVEKGSVCINGVSLTAFDVDDQSFSVIIIPYTYDHTTFHTLSNGNLINLEYDILGKYVQRMLVV